MTAPRPGAEPQVVVVGHGRSGSGAERVLLRYVDAMAAAGRPLGAICPEGFLRDELRSRGIHPTTIPELQLPAGPKPLAVGRLATRWLRAAITIRRAVPSSSVLVVNGLLALPAVRLAGVASRSTWLVHDVVVRSDLQTVAKAAMGGLASAVAVSKAAGAFPARHGVPTEIVRNGTVWPVEPATPDPSARPVVGINAMVTSWKGHHVLLDAVAGLPDVDLEVMGGRFPKDAPYVEQLRRRAAQPDLDGRVRFLGHVDDPLETMRSWSVAVSASVDPEAGPLAVLEAMSLGVPVVATSHGGAVEVVGDAGLLVEPGSAESLRDALTTLMLDEDLRRRCSDAGRTTVAAGLTEKASNDAFLAAVGRLIDERVER